MSRLLNAMTVDVEEHFQVSAFESAVPRCDWESLPSRVEANTERVAQLLDDFDVRATFFVLGWVAERHSRLIRRLADLGHEIASHGYGHDLVYRQTREGFRTEVLRSKKILEDVLGHEIAGYRAASFSIRRGNLWALEELASAGFAYDSSLFPVVHDRYGLPGAPRQIHRIQLPSGKTLIEVPPSTLKLGGATLPVLGGGYLRLYPAAITRWAMRRLNHHDRMPAVVYMHPWELDIEQPRIRASLASRFRHYVGLSTTAAKLRELLVNFRFGPIREILSHLPELQTVDVEVA